MKVLVIQEIWRNPTAVMSLRVKLFLMLATAPVLMAAGMLAVQKTHPSWYAEVAQHISPAVPALVGAQPVDIALHKALYKLKLVSAESSAGLSGVNGQMYYEQDDSCDAYTNEHRFSVEYQYPERRPIKDTNHYVAWEAKDGSGFYFSSDRQEGPETTEQLRGSVAQNDDGSATAVYVRPPDLSYDLPKGYFLPTAHTSEVIRRARAGDPIFNAFLFDGTDADGPVEVNTVIGPKATGEELQKIASARKEIDPALLVPEAWHMRMAIFPLKDKDSMSPAYEINMIMHANGIVSDALIDYRNFKVAQTLLALEKIPPKPCK